MDFFKKIFGVRGIKPETTSAVKVAEGLPVDPFSPENNVVVQDKNGLEQMKAGAAIIAKEERVGKPIEQPTEGKPPVA